MPQIELKPLPPAEAVAFFRNKGFVIGFEWRAVVKGTKDGRETFLTVEPAATPAVVPAARRMIGGKRVRRG